MPELPGMVKRNWGIEIFYAAITLTAFLRPSLGYKKVIFHPPLLSNNFLQLCRKHLRSNRARFFEEKKIAEFF